MTDDKVAVGLEDQIKALEAAVAVLDGDTDRFEAAVRSAGDRYGGLNAFIYALAHEVGNGITRAVGRESAADDIEETLSLYRVSVEFWAKHDAENAASQARLAAVTAAVAEAVEGDA